MTQVALVCSKLDRLEFVRRRNCQSLRVGEICQLDSSDYSYADYGQINVYELISFELVSQLKMN